MKPERPIHRRLPLSAALTPLIVGALLGMTGCEPFALPSISPDGAAFGPLPDLAADAGWDSLGAAPTDGSDTTEDPSDRRPQADAGLTDAGLTDGSPSETTGPAAEDAEDAPAPTPDTATDPGPPPVEPTGPLTPTEAAFHYVNTARETLGLRPLRSEPALQAAAIAHADFLVQHHQVYADASLSAHIEPEGLPGFTGRTFSDRLLAAGYDGRPMAEVVAFKPSAVGAARSWMESLYHRLPLLDPAIDEAGFGETGSGARYANVMEMGQREDDADPPAFIVWPAPDAVSVPFAWDGAEIPQPSPPPAGYPSGPVITLQASGGALVVSHATVHLVPDGLPVTATFLTADNDSHLRPDVLSLIPHTPLQPGSTYEVRVGGFAGPEAFELAWTFRTRGEGCDAVAQDCGPGQGCYPLTGTPTCLWAGARELDEACDYVNDCGEGLTCFGSRCRPLCDLSSGACEAECPAGTGQLHDNTDVAVCLPASCGADPNLCADGEGCYWVGAFACDWSGDAASGESCTYSNDCRAGLGCLGLAGVFRCRDLCDGPGLPACKDVCAAGAQLLDPANGVKFCL